MFKLVPMLNQMYKNMLKLVVNKIGTYINDFGTSKIYRFILEFKCLEQRINVYSVNVMFKCAP